MTSGTSFIHIACRWSLPGPSPDEAYYRSQEGRPFVRQLDYLHLRTQRIRYAVKDDYQAFSQRTKWGVDGLLRVGELSAYEADLKE